MVKNYKGRHALRALVFAAFFAAAAAIVMLLWNAIVPGLAGWGVLTYWKAAGLLLLCRLLLGGFGRRGFGHPMMGHAKRHMGHMEEMREKMRGMSHDERREYIRRRMEEYHGGGCCEPGAGADPKTESAE